MNDLAALTLQIPIHHVGSLKELLRDHPGLELFRRGWIVSTFAIIGPPDAIERFRPKLQEWQSECASADAL